MSDRIMFASVEECPIQMVTMNDDDFDGIVVMTNYGNFYRYSTRFNEWYKLEKPLYEENDHE